MQHEKSKYELLREKISLLFLTAIRTSAFWK